MIEAEHVCMEDIRLKGVNQFFSSHLLDYFQSRFMLCFKFNREEDCCLLDYREYDLQHDKILQSYYSRKGRK